MSDGLAIYFDGIPPGEITLSGPIPSMTGDARLFHVVQSEPASMSLSGVIPSALSGNVTISDTLSGSLSLKGIAPNKVGAIVFASKAEINLEGVVPSVSWKNKPSPAVLTFNGKTDVGVTAAVISVPAPAAKMNFSGAEVTTYVYNIYKIPSPLGKQELHGPIPGLTSFVYTDSAELQLSGKAIKAPSASKISVPVKPASLGLSGQIVSLKIKTFWLDANLTRLNLFISVNQEPPWPIEIDLPCLETTFHGGGPLSETLPSFEFFIEASPSRLADFVTSLPGFDMSAFIGGYIGEDLPRLTASMETTSEHLSELYAVLSRFKLSADLTQGYSGQLDLTFHTFTLEQNAGCRIETELPSLFFDVTPGRVCEIEITLPSFGLTHICGTKVETEFPSLTSDFRLSTACKIEAAFPSLGLNQACGANVVAVFSLERFTGDMSHEQSVSFIGDIETDLPAFGFTGEIIWDNTGQITVQMPKLKGRLISIYGATASVSASLLKINLSGEMTPGQVGLFDLTTILPMRLKISASPTGPAEIKGSFQAMSMALRTGEIKQEVLRYQKDRIR